MTRPFDNLFGQGATEALVEAATIDGNVPSITQTLAHEDEVLITLIWPGIVAQNVRFNSTTREAAWGVGLCDAPRQGFLQRFAAQVFNPIGIELGIEFVSVCAPKAYEAPFLEMGLRRDPEDIHRLIADIAPGSALGQWSESTLNE